MSILIVLLLAAIQGLCELLPVSSSAHVIVAEKLLGLDPSSPQMTFLLVMLHTGTMFAVIIYFWRAWRESYFVSFASAWDTFKQVCVATFFTAIVGGALLLLIEKVLMRGQPKAEIEDLFGNLTIIAIALVAAGFMIIVAGHTRSQRATQESDAPLTSGKSALIGAVQGLCLPFRGFSRSGATISTALLLGIKRLNAENFSFALAVVLTPPVIARELMRLHQAKVASGNFGMLVIPGIVGMFCSFVAGLIALRLLSKVLETHRWQWFGYYCVLAGATLFFIRGYV